LRAINFFVFVLAKLVYHVSPRLKDVLAGAVLRLSVGDSVTSVYGVKLKKNWKDKTFRLCASAHYGHYFSDFLRAFRTPFSFVDIGANVGLYSLIAAANPHVRTVYSFEPNPAVHALLLQNAALNRARLEPYMVAIASEEGEHAFSFDDVHTGMGSLVATKGRHTVVNCRNYAVFDEIQAADATLKVVKIDVEGFEPVVVEQLLRSDMAPAIGYVYFEADEERFDVRGLCAVLEHAGFRLQHKNGAGVHYDLMYSRQ
jgi:FkbM family methyltransferase